MTEPQTTPQISEEVTPQLRITGLTVNDLGPIQKLTLPDDGLGWKGTIPDIITIGGVNGSGKTTLLNLLFDVLRSFPGGASKDLTIRLRFLFGYKDDTQQNQIFVITFDHISEISPNELPEATSPFNEQARHIGYSGGEDRKYQPGQMAWQSCAEKLTEIIGQDHPDSEIPRLVYIPTNRSLELPHVAMKQAGKLADTQPFAYRWHRPDQWEESLEALLYAARWEDLNAKEEGRPTEAIHFAQYSDAFERFFEKKKALTWHKGELFVEIKDTGKRHSLEELSSGEKQILILASELFRRWKPGSLILIDEPELHLHTSWQTRLWELICDLQQERGGQVIIATQSNHIFQLGKPGTKLLLGGKTLA